VWGGEFGRMPFSEGNGAPGRNHNPYGFSMWLAGGGVKGGMAYGATDEFGFEAVENRVHLHDLHATILHLMGMDHEQLTYFHQGRDERLTDVYGRVVQEILA
jgi:arylsulfatase A-like enzyme